MATPQPRKLDYSAPVGSVDMPAFDEGGAPYEIWPCHDCLPWHIEIVRQGIDVLVREWHAVDCQLFQQLLADS